MEKNIEANRDEGFPAFSVSGVYVEHALPDKPRAVPPILFVHGGLHGSWCWRPMMRYLCDRGWPCYALNWYNHYRSDCLPLERFVRRTILDVTEEIGLITKRIGQPPILIGHSCRIPDHHIVPSRSPLFLAREVFRELAGDGNVTDREVFVC